MKKITTRFIVTAACLAAIEIILQVIGNYIAIGPISINLSLIPIAIGAIFYGPLMGLFLGFVNGFIVLFAPSTIAVFMPLSFWGTVLTCLAKGMLAGLLSGFIYLPFKNKHQTLGSIIASIGLPIINTALFSGFCLLFFQSYLINSMGNFPNMYAFLFLGVIGWNFIFELASSIILSPAVVRIMKIYQNKKGE